MKLVLRSRIAQCLGLRLASHQSVPAAEEDDDDDGECEEEVRKDEEGQLSVLISLRTRGVVTVLLLHTLRLTLLS